MILYTLKTANLAPPSLKIRKIQNYRRTNRSALLSPSTMTMTPYAIGRYESRLRRREILSLSGSSRGLAHLSGRTGDGPSSLARHFLVLGRTESYTSVIFSIRHHEVVSSMLPVRHFLPRGSKGASARAPNSRRPGPYIVYFDFAQFPRNNQREE